MLNIKKGRKAQGEMRKGKREKDRKSDIEEGKRKREEKDGTKKR